MLALVVVAGELLFVFELAPFGYTIGHQRIEACGVDVANGNPTVLMRPPGRDYGTSISADT